MRFWTLLLMLIPAFANAQTASSMQVATAASAAASASRGTSLSLGLGYGVHRYFGIDGAQELSHSRRFDGSYIQAEAAWVGTSGGFVGLDLSRYAGGTCFDTDSGGLRLGVTTDTVAAAAGVSVGSRLRLRLSTFGGIAFAQLDRSLGAEPYADTHRSFAERPLFGGEVGVELALTRWLVIGGRGRLSFTWDGASGQDLGGIFTGLTASVVL